MSSEFDQLLRRIQALTDQEKRVIIAIDGPCGAGKSTLAFALSEHFDCNIFHMDDFFLQPHQRTPERLAQPGGNFDRERFLQEVLEPLQKGLRFCYRPYDCKTAGMSAPITVTPKALSIVEGSYSCHPDCADIYNLRIYMPIRKELQLQRLQHRSPHLYQRFLQEWIPMEQAYFHFFSIPSQCDLIYETP